VAKQVTMTKEGQKSTQVAKPVMMTKEGNAWENKPTPVAVANI